MPPVVANSDPQGLTEPIKKNQHITLHPDDLEAELSQIRLVSLVSLDVVLDFTAPL